MRSGCRCGPAWGRRYVGSRSRHVAVWRKLTATRCCNQDTAFRAIKTNRSTAVAQMVDRYQIIVVADYDESTSLLSQLGALTARILRLTLGTEEYADKVHSNKNLFAHIPRMKPLLTAAAKLSRSQQSFLVQATDRVLLTGPLGEDNRQTLRGQLARGCTRSAPNVFHAFLFARGKLAASWARDPVKEGSVLPSDLVLLNLMRCAIKREARSAAKARRDAEKEKKAANDQRRVTRRKQRKQRTQQSSADARNGSDEVVTLVDLAGGPVSAELYSALLEYDNRCSGDKTSKMSEANRAMLLKMQARRRQREQKGPAPEPEPEPEPELELELEPEAKPEPKSAGASPVTDNNAAVIADSAATGSDGHTSNDDHDSDLDSDGSVADGNDGGCSSDDGWESEDEEEL
eukprot:COSAG02_NODE_11216_length_1769_cov_1.677246_1_plen_402_part_01